MALTLSLTGGCQCGALRYEVRAAPRKPHVCHCRMCQKAFGVPFAALVAVDLGDLVFVRGAPAVFMSSEMVERGFCRDYGTPLTFRYVDTDEIDVALCTLDDPSAVVPERAFGVESRVAWADGLPGLPSSTTEGDVPVERMARLRSRQHPDRPTESWPEG